MSAHQRNPTQNTNPKIKMGSEPRVNDHIHSYKGKYSNHIKNGILLRGDIHTLFDLSKIRIRSNHKVDICPDLQSTIYKEFHNKRLILPKARRDWPTSKRRT